jgi:peptidoglycan/LPS O-acetylase OafA/YrhL
MIKIDFDYFERKQAKPANSFDAIRLIAALSVLVAHQLSFAGEYLPGYAPPTLGIWGPKLADAGLYVFFALSGFLLFGSLRSGPRPIRFLAARFLRIYPGAAVNILACLLFAAATTSVSQTEFWQSAITRQFVFHNILIVVPPTEFQLPGFVAKFPYPAVNASIWTLKYELLAYVCLLVIFFALIYRPKVMQAVLMTVAILMAFAFFYTRIFPTDNGPGLDSLGSFYAVHTYRFFMVFFLGATYGAVQPISFVGRSLFFVTSSLIMIFNPSIHISRIIFIMLLAIAAIELGKTSLLYNRAHSQIGDLSYGTYLYAYPIQIFTITYFLNDHNFVQLTLIDIAIVLFCAILSWRFVEHPALKLKDRL